MLERLHYDNVHVKVGDGYQGWPEHAPFDKIIVTCSPEKVPPALVEQLKEGGRMVIPVGERYQQTLYLLKKTDGKMVSEALQPTLFVPMTGKAEAGREVLPDPTRPAIDNGGFESVAGDPPAPTGWHYQRQLKVVDGQGRPRGRALRHLQQRHAGPQQPGPARIRRRRAEGARSCSFRRRSAARTSGPARTHSNCPASSSVSTTRTGPPVGEAGLGPWRGTFDWQPETKRINVPLKAREAVLRIGLLGAVGEISFDAIEVKAVKK